MISNWDLTLTTEVASALLRSMPDVTKANLVPEKIDIHKPCKKLQNFYKWLNNQV